MTQEEAARKLIDAQLKACEWVVQTKDIINLSAARGVAVGELSFNTGEPDYTLFVDGKAIAIIEAKPVGHSLIGAKLFNTANDLTTLARDCGHDGSQFIWNEERHF